MPNWEVKFPRKGFTYSNWHEKTRNGNSDLHSKFSLHSPKEWFDLIFLFLSHHKPTTLLHFSRGRELWTLHGTCWNPHRQSYVNLVPTVFCGNAYRVHYMFCLFLILGTHLILSAASMMKCINICEVLARGSGTWVIGSGLTITIIILTILQMSLAKVTKPRNGKTGGKPSLSSHRTQSANTYLLCYFPKATWSDAMRPPECWGLFSIPQVGVEHLRLVPLWWNLDGFLTPTVKSNFLKNICCSTACIFDK